MARKTKQEKIIAELRRKLQAQQERPASVASQIREKPKPEFRAKDPIRPSVDTFSVPTDLIKKDLLRTAILTIVAISLEVVVYLIWR